MARPLKNTDTSTRSDYAERSPASTAEIEAADGPPKCAVRPRFSLEEKIALLLEAGRHGETIFSVGRRPGISNSILFHWRDPLGLGQASWLARTIITDSLRCYRAAMDELYNGK
ncbi:transposase [Leptolyngbya sp. 15MV]|nr:transposase [Leptolyngbya sp. 15MV]